MDITVTPLSKYAAEQVLQVYQAAQHAYKIWSHIARGDMPTWMAEIIRPMDFSIEGIYEPEEIYAQYMGKLYMVDDCIRYETASGFGTYWFAPESFGFYGRRGSFKAGSSFVVMDGMYRPQSLDPDWVDVRFFPPISVEDSWSARVHVRGFNDANELADCVDVDIVTSTPNVGILMSAEEAEE